MLRLQDMPTQGSRGARGIDLEVELPLRLVLADAWHFGGLLQRVRVLDDVYRCWEHWEESLVLNTRMRAVHRYNGYVSFLLPYGS